MPTAIWKHYEILNKLPLGLTHDLPSGAYSNVYLVRNTRDDQLYALKEIDLTRYKNLDLLHNEIAIHSTLPPSPYIVQYHEHFLSAHHAYLITEYGGTDLFETLVKFHLSLDESEAKWILTMICRGLQHCHQHQIIHGDLKPENIAISKSGLKLLDFGLAKHRDKAPLVKFSGTKPYRAPDQDLVLASDLWSVAVIFYELLFGVGCDPYHPKFPRECHPHIIDLITQMWHLDPTKRPTIEQVLQHPYLQENSQTDHKSTPPVWQNVLDKIGKICGLW